MIAAADDAGVTAYGSYKTTTEEVAVANSLGIRVSEERTLGHLIVVTMGADREAGYAEGAAVDHTNIDAAALGREAAQKARAGRGAVAIDPGEYPVVLEAYAVVDLLDMLGYLGFSALAVQEDRSFFEPGKKIGSDLVTIRDDATDPAGTPASFDYEGVGKQKVTLVERGVCREVVYDAETAAKEGRRSTGHGLPAPNTYGPFPLNQLMEAGSASREDLIGGLDRGLLVTRFHYTNPVHPKLAMVTGMTRDGVFLVEKGSIVGPVKNLRFTQSYLAALAGVEAVGAGAQAAPRLPRVGGRAGTADLGLHLHRGNRALNPASHDRRRAGPGAATGGSPAVAEAAPVRRPRVARGAPRRGHRADLRGLRAPRAAGPPRRGAAPGRVPRTGAAP